MGWNSWNSFGCGPKMTATHIEAIADTLVSSGLAAAGYEFVNLDDCWASAKRASGAIPLRCAPSAAHYSLTARARVLTRDLLTLCSDGSISGSPDKFPSMKALANYVHIKDLKFGLCASLGGI